MHPDEFRRHAHELVDWMADYLRDVGTMPITPAVAPGDIRRQIPAAPPIDAEPFEALFDDFRRVIVPGMTHWNHPGWFAYFPCNNSPPSILGEMLTATLGAQCMSWVTSPAATELEQVVLDWLRQMLDLPAGWVGVIQDTASTATLVALLTARDRATAGRAGSHGLAAAGAQLRVYASREAHSSIDKAVKLAGYGLEHLRSIETDDVFALRPDALLGTFQATPEYLRTSYDADVVNFRDWGIQLGRRFRALKLWFVIRSYGVDGLRAIVRRHVALARELAGWVNADPEFELMAPVPFGLVCFRWCPPGRSEEELDALNARLLAAVNAGRERYLTHTRLAGRYAIRLVVGQRGTEREHVHTAWESVQRAAEGLR